MYLDEYKYAGSLSVCSQFRNVLFSSRLGRSSRRSLLEDSVRPEVSRTVQTGFAREKKEIPRYRVVEVATHVDQVWI